VRKDYEPGVLAPSQKSASELAARDAFSREHPPLRRHLPLPRDPGTGLLRTMRLHRIERHPV
jgi:hypothetical protein